MKTLLSLFIILTLFSACSTAIRISTKGCRFKKLNKVRMGSNEEILYNEGHWFMDHSFGNSTLYLKDLMKSKKMSCEDIGQLSYEVKQGALESFLSLLPFVHRERIIVRGIN